MKNDTPSWSESCTRKLVASTSPGGSRRSAAHTGAPVCASTALMPSVRSSVLLPDIFEPVTSRNVPGGPSVTSLATRLSAQAAADGRAR